MIIIYRVFFAIIACSFLLACNKPMSMARFNNNISNKYAEVNRGNGCALRGDIHKYSLDKHVLVSDSQGDIPNDRHNPYRYRKGSLLVAFNSIMAGYSKAVDESNNHPPRLLFYFHGGLNSQAEVEAQAARQIPCMMEDGYYPVFFVWNTDFFDSYSEQITSIWNGYLDNETFWIKLRAPFFVASQIISGVAQEPLDIAADSQRFYNTVSDDMGCSYLVPTAPKGCRSDYVGTPDLHFESSKLVVDSSADRPTNDVGKFLSYIALYPVRLVATPIAHGLGEAAWQNFLRRTRTTLHQSWEYLTNFETNTENNRKNTLTKSYPNGSGVFSQFFEVLRQYGKGEDGKRLKEVIINEVWGPHNYSILCPRIIKNPEKDKTWCGNRIKSISNNRERDARISALLSKAKITLVGHSMGGIVINELVDNFPDLNYNDIVVMASAASYRDTQRVMSNYFESSINKKNEPRFFSLMLHPLNDARERQIGGAIPSGSLLIWIDEMYEVPKTPGDRTFGYWPNIKAARQMFRDKAQEKTLYRVFNLRDAKIGEEVNPVEHGDFNNDEMCFWRPAFWGVTGPNWGKDKLDYWKNRYNDLPETALNPCIKTH